MPSERPILFSASMVRALLDGRKTQTRRVVKFRDCNEDHSLHSVWRAWNGKSHDWQDRDEVIRCPYGALGDRLWVRETWGKVRMHDLTQHVYCGPRVPDRMQVVYRAGKQMGIPVGSTSPMQFRTEWRDDLQPDRWRPSIHMPRWASRLTLEITDVRVERLQQISEVDALAEGVSAREAAVVIKDNERQRDLENTARGAFCCLWDSLNAARGDGWGANPWVWAIAFRRVGGADA